MLKRQVWMVDDEFDDIVKNSQRVLKLSNQHKNHLYVKEFTKKCNVTFVYRTYVLEGETDANFSLNDICELFQESLNSARNFCRQMINCMKAWNYLQKALDFPLNTQIISQANGLMMEDVKDVLAEEYRKSSVFSGYHIFALACYIEKYIEIPIFRLHETENDDLIMAATNLFGNIINIHPLKDGNRRICHVILAHVLNEMLSISSHFKLFS